MMYQLTEHNLDALKELINIGVGRAAGALNAMVSFRIGLQVPFVKVLSPKELSGEMAALGRSRLAAVRLGFDGPFSGTAALVFPTESASKLVAVLTGEEPGTPEIDSVRAGTLSEVGNIVINGVMGSMGNMLKQRITYTLPNYTEDSVQGLLRPDAMDEDATVLLVRTHFSIQELEIEGDIILLFTVGSFDALLSAIDGMH